MAEYLSLMSMKKNVEITYLEIKKADEWSPVRPVAGLVLRQLHVAFPEFNRFLYTAVGGDWFWVDRLSWTYDDWLECLNRPEHQTWVAYWEGVPAGYFELDDQSGDVEITYFGLLPQLIGRGLGRDLLSRAIEQSWQQGAERVWLHTCSLDSPAAIQNYLARGFVVYKTEREEVELPDISPGPWPGAR